MQRFRVLVVDDNRSIHDDFRKILTHRADADDEELSALEAELFGEKSRPDAQVEFDLACATQGNEGFELARDAYTTNDPFALAFVDMRMPPGWDGLRTIEAIWESDPHVQVVICSAYSDYSWSEITERLGSSDRLLILKKPFDNVEVLQLAHALTSKWTLTRAMESRVDELDGLVARKTQELERSNSALKAEITARDKVEAELRLSQKLEAVGQLAAGIAHEINTPIQYVGNSLHFLEEGFSDLIRLHEAYGEHLRKVDSAPKSIDAAEQDADVEFLLDEIPQALERAQSGIYRVTEIVGAMKEFAHPGARTKELSDLNQGIQSTLSVARNEYKYVADIELQLGELPLVECHLGDINQVVLNLIVNAAHAIQDALAEGERGKIVIATECDADDCVRIIVTDTGRGVPEDIMDRVFDPFFTTKEVGRGSGQGLSIARTIIVERHGGRMEIENLPEGGAKFVVELPLVARAPMHPPIEAVA